MIKGRRHRNKANAQNQSRRRINRQHRYVTATNSNTSDLKPIISRKMRIPILVLCLAVIYGTCRVYGESDHTLDTVQYDEYYSQNDAIAPLEESLSRHKRTIFPIASLARRMVSKAIQPGVGALDKVILNFSRLADRVLQKLELCPNTEEPSLEVLGTLVLHPMDAPRMILCYAISQIRSGGCELITKFFNCLSEFIRQVLLPALYERMNSMAKNHSLPECLKPLLPPFDAIYLMLAMTGYVPMLRPSLPFF